jgi:adenylate cyclase
MVGLVGAREERSYTVIGDTVNLAHRIQRQAPEGGVALGPQTLRALDGARVRPLGPIEIRGKREPVDVFVLEAL